MTAMGPAKTTYVEKETPVCIPTLELSMKDQVNAKNANVGEQFAAETIHEITINGVTYPCGSTVTGQVVEVIRPSGCEKGALKLAFTDIKMATAKQNYLNKSYKLRLTNLKT